jgi:hypothetical protein
MTNSGAEMTLARPFLASENHLICMKNCGSTSIRTFADFEGLKVIN